MNKEAIYVHVPWCRRRCPYCDFYFEVGQPDEAFVSALIREFEARAPFWLKGPAQSLYFGGGTPSMLSVAEINKLIDFLLANNALSRDAEITLEANPEDISESYALALGQSFISRISLGIQSFDDRILAILGRMHRSEQAMGAIDALQSAGFKNISVDLIMGVGGEDPSKIIASLNTLAARGIPHLSTYLLTIEEKTAFYRRIKKGLMAKPEEDDQVSIYRLVQKELKSLGFVQYDISSFGLMGSFSRHNQVYWAEGSFLGLGSGAHSMRLLDGAIERAHNKRPLKEWLLKSADEDDFIWDRLTKADGLLESMAFGLRNMHKGVNMDELCLRHQSPRPKDLDRVLAKMCDFKWLSEAHGRHFITEAGALFADAIMSEILSC